MRAKWFWRLVRYSVFAFLIVTAAYTGPFYLAMFLNGVIWGRLLLPQ